MTIEEARAAVWDYHHMQHELEAADLIWVLGSHDLRVADRAAELWHAGYAPEVLMSGGYGNFTEGVFEAPEAELLAQRAQELGVPGEVIRLESRSTNCGENVLFSRELLERAGKKVESVIAVQKPYMERRTFATIRAQWPEVAVRVTSPQLSFEAYTAAQIGAEEVTTIMVGDLQRIWEYPQHGWMISQDVPERVREAWEVLVAAGYDGHLLTE